MSAVMRIHIEIRQERVLDVDEDASVVLPDLV